MNKDIGTEGNHCQIIEMENTGSNNMSSIQNAFYIQSTNTGRFNLYLNNLYRHHRNPFNVQLEFFGFNLECWTDGKQTNEAIKGNPRTPHIDGLQFPTFIYKKKKSAPSYMTTTPEADSLVKKKSGHERDSYKICIMFL